MRRLLLFFCVAIVATAAAAWWLLPGRNNPVTVESVTPSRGELRTTLALTGTVVNDYTVQLTALLNGEVTTIKAREGDRVAAGTVLATLDDEPSRAQQTKATAELAMREHELNLATRRHERMRRVSQAGDESGQALDNSLMDRQRAQAAVLVAEADLTLAQLAVRNASIRAPYAGVITAQAVETGQWVEAGTRLFTLVAEAGRAVEAEADAGDFNRVAVDQDVSLSIDERPDAAWQSTITRIAESVTTGNGATGNTFTVRIALGDDAPELLLGQQVDVDITTSQRADVLRLPMAAIIESSDGSTDVWVEDQGKAQKRSVSLGLRTIDQAEVLDGIDTNTIILLPAGVPLTEGLSVAVVR